MAAVVHECLFCSQTFDSAENKDDHVLQHFIQETCTDCDQKLIRIGRHLFTLHDSLTCLKRTPKLEVDIGSQNAIQHEPENLLPEFQARMENNISEQTEEIEEFKVLDEVSINSYGRTDELTESNKRGDDLQNEFRDPIHSNDLQIKAEPVKETEQSGEYITPIDVNEIIASKSKTSCDICGKVLSSRCGLRRHKIMLHSSPDTIFCNVCGRLFKNVEERDVHRIDCALKKRIRKKTKSKNQLEFWCDICKQKFKSKDCLRNHMKSKHDPSLNIFKCGLCSAKFQRESSLQIHQQKHESGEFDAKSKECEICGKMLSSGGALYKHKIYLHSSSDTIFCNSCGRLFKNSEEHDVHRIECAHKKKIRNMKGSGDELCCEICKKQFKSNNCLRSHMKLKHDPKVATYECGICSERFQKAHWLQAHQRKHENGVSCETCGKVFGYTSSLNKHKTLSHSSPDTIFCNVCGRRFPNVEKRDDHRTECARKFKTRHIDDWKRKKISQPSLSGADQS